MRHTCADTTAGNGGQPCAACMENMARSGLFAGTVIGLPEHDRCNAEITALRTEIHRLRELLADSKSGVMHQPITPGERCKESCRRCELDTMFASSTADSMNKESK